MVRFRPDKLFGVLCSGIKSSLALVLYLFVLTISEASPTPINSDLLAEFAFRVSRYTTWPEKKDHYQIHAVGLTPGQKASITKLANRSLKEKPVIVTFDDEVTLSDDDLPEVVIVSGSISVDPSEWCFAQAPVLVIAITDSTDSKMRFCKSAIIAVDSNRGRVEFEANLTQAKKTGLQLSARMLRLARKVR